MTFGTAALLWAMFAPSPISLAINPAQAIDPVRWITTNDYPPVSIERKESGTTEVTLHVTATGQVERCTVAASSGSSLLDATTCALMQQRGRFLPATDRNGRAVASIDTKRFTWQIPTEAPLSTEEQAQVDWVPKEMSVGVTVNVDIDDQGAVKRCTSNRSVGNGQDVFATMLDQMGKELCVQTAQGEASHPLRDKSGKAVPSRLTFTIKADLTRR